MVRKRWIILGSFIVMFILSSCGLTSKYKPVLPENYNVFELTDFQSEDYEEDNCKAFYIGDKRYLFYSDLPGQISEKNVRECLGCTSQDGINNEDELILSLNDCADDEYLIVFYDVPALMASQPAVYRMEDTRFKEIQTPKYIKDPTEGNPMYHYWMGN